MFSTKSNRIICALSMSFSTMWQVTHIPFYFGMDEVCVCVDMSCRESVKCIDNGRNGHPSPPISNVWSKCCWLVGWLCVCCRTIFLRPADIYVGRTILVNDACALGSCVTFALSIQTIKITIDFECLGCYFAHYNNRWHNHCIRHRWLSP